MYRIIQATTRPLSCTFVNLVLPIVSSKRERGSSSHDLHPSSRLRTRATNHRAGINAIEAVQKEIPLRVLRPAECEGAANENWESCFSGV
jgi:hypothetical protein